MIVFNSRINLFILFVCHSSNLYEVLRPVKYAVEDYIESILIVQDNCKFVSHIVAMELELGLLDSFYFSFAL